MVNYECSNMKMIHVFLFASLILTLALSGCIGGNPDDEFRKAWQDSENDVIKYGEDMRIAMGPEGNVNVDIIAMSKNSKAMIDTIDRHYNTISNIQVSSKYATAKQDYLAALSSLRMACVDMSKMQDAGSIEALGYLSTAAPWLQDSQEKRDRVKEMMKQ